MPFKAARRTGGRVGRKYTGPPRLGRKPRMTPKRRTAYEIAQNKAAAQRKLSAKTQYPDPVTRRIKSDASKLFPLYAREELKDKAMISIEELQKIVDLESAPQIKSGLTDFIASARNRANAMTDEEFEFDIENIRATSRAELVGDEAVAFVEPPRKLLAYSN